MAAGEEVYVGEEGDMVRFGGEEDVVFEDVDREWGGERRIRRSGSGGGRGGGSGHGGRS